MSLFFENTKAFFGFWFWKQKNDTEISSSEIQLFLHTLLFEN